MKASLPCAGSELFAALYPREEEEEEGGRELGASTAILHQVRIFQSCFIPWVAPGHPHFAMGMYWVSGVAELVVNSAPHGACSPLPWGWAHPLAPSAYGGCFFITQSGIFTADPWKCTQGWSDTHLPGNDQLRLAASTSTDISWGHLRDCKKKK